jgi:hypothetical protein
MKHAHSFFSKISLVVSVFTLCSCGVGGGGGGGSDFVGAAETSVEASPSTIDTGDRTEVKIDISDVHPNGIVLKVRIPKGLSYVPSSAFLTLDDDPIDIGPKKNVTKDNYVYLVFFLTQAQFGDDGQGRISFQLVGNSSLEDGKIDVDADVNDPLKNDDTEFNASNPTFEPEASTDIEVS